MYRFHVQKTQKYSIRVLMLFLVMLTLGPPVNAQEAIALNDTKIGQILNAGGVVPYTFTAQQGQSVTIEVIAASDGFVPQFSIYNSNNALVQTIGNPNSALVVENTINFTQAGLYRIDVSSVAGVVGQFIIQLSPGVPPASAVPLSPNTPAASTLAINERTAYSFNANPQSTSIIEVSTNGSAGLTTTLMDANGAVIGTLGSSLSGGRFDIPPGQSTYRLEMSNDGSLSALVNYQVSMLAGGQIAATATPITQLTPTAQGVSLPSLPEGGDCVIATATGTGVNIRAGTSTSFDVIGQMDIQTVYAVDGTNFDRTWFYIEFSGQFGWVAASVTRLGGSCTDLRIVESTLPVATPVTGPTTIPLPTDIPTLAEYDQLCRETYGSTSFAGSFGGCYTCPDYSSIPQREISTTLSCIPHTYVRATQHQRATGLIGTDCPAGSGQFFDPNGFCYSCPPGYNRTVFPVTSGEACEWGRGAPPDATYLGSLD